MLALFLLGGIALVVVAIVYYLARKEGGGDRGLLVGCVVAGMAPILLPMAAWLLLRERALEPESWRLWVLAQVALCAAGTAIPAAWVGLFWDGRKTALIWAGWGALIGPLFVLHGVLDLARGPLVITGGTIVAHQKTRECSYSLGPVDPGSTCIDVTSVRVRTTSGAEHEFSFYPYSSWQDRARDCQKGTTIDLTVLRHMERELAVRCEARGDQ